MESLASDELQHVIRFVDCRSRLPLRVVSRFWNLSIRQLNQYEQRLDDDRQSGRSRFDLQEEQMSWIMVKFSSLTTIIDGWWRRLLQCEERLDEDMLCESITLSRHEKRMLRIKVTFPNLTAIILPQSPVSLTLLIHYQNRLQVIQVTAITNMEHAKRDTEFPSLRQLTITEMNGQDLVPVVAMFPNVGKINVNSGRACLPADQVLKHLPRGLTSLSCRVMDPKSLLSLSDMESLTYLMLDFGSEDHVAEDTSNDIRDNLCLLSLRELHVCSGTRDPIEYLLNRLVAYDLQVLRLLCDSWIYPGFLWHLRMRRLKITSYECAAYDRIDSEIIDLKMKNVTSIQHLKISQGFLSHKSLERLSHGILFPDLRSVQLLDPENEFPPDHVIAFLTSDTARRLEEIRLQSCCSASPEQMDTINKTLQSLRQTGKLRDGVIGWCDWEEKYRIPKREGQESRSELWKTTTNFVTCQKDPVLPSFLSKVTTHQLLQLLYSVPGLRVSHSFRRRLKVWRMTGYHFLSNNVDYLCHDCDVSAESEVVLRRLVAEGWQSPLLSDFHDYFWDDCFRKWKDRETIRRNLNPIHYL